MIDHHNISEYVTAITYSPSGDIIVVGTHNGICKVFDFNPKIRFSLSFNCRNRIGKFALGKKVTNIQFVNRTHALITTNDSRMRLANISDGKIISKYKSHSNDEYMIRAFPDYLNDLIISASQDGNVFVWNKNNKENTNKKTNKKNYGCEFFRPFAKDTPTCSFFMDDLGTASYVKKVFNLTTKIIVSSIIINASIMGRLQVILNCEQNDVV